MAGTSLTEEDAANQNSCNESPLGESNMTPECQSSRQQHHLESGTDGHWMSEGDQLLVRQHSGRPSSYSDRYNQPTSVYRTITLVYSIFLGVMHAHHIFTAFPLRPIEDRRPPEFHP
jgi:hypothetical protein